MGMEQKPSGEPAAKPEDRLAEARDPDRGEVPDPAGEPDGSVSHGKEAPSWIGRRVGAYRLLSMLGQGGMGAVYLARHEGEYEREVALKLVLQGAGKAKVRQRFAVERQALARLEHPNIARLYGGGSTEEGLPYLVMERVDGLPVDRYCDTERLGIRERLGLFLRICAAVTHAHHHLLVHCDIKPTN
ncbi:MAG: protein kinase, partial [Holophagales bacterium]|nr:protein kinase [Holophagales bacterium]